MPEQFILALAFVDGKRVEKELSNAAKDAAKEKIGYDIEKSLQPNRQLRFIEVKGRRKDATTVTITKK